MKLYEIDELISRCVVVNDSEAVDTATGEVIDIDYLNSLEMERDKKIEYLIKLHLNCKSDAESLKAEAQKFQKRAKAEENKAEQIKSYLAYIQNGEKFKSEDGLHQISFRKTTSIEVPDVSVLDECYLRYKDPEADKTAIKEAIKSGIDVKGATLIEKLSPTIK